MLTQTPTPPGSDPGTTIAVGVAIACSLAGGLWGWRRVRSHAGEPELRWLALCAPIGWLSIAAAVAGVLAMAPFRDWSGARLAWSASLLGGYGLYSGPDTGPVLSSIYGPVAPLLYLPALLTGEVTSAMILACAMSVALALGPLVLLVCRGRMADPRGRVVASAVAVCALAAAFSLPSIRNIGFQIHVDGPAVGFGLLSCMLLAGTEPPRARKLWAAAGLTALAVWTKQVEVTLGLAQLCYVAVVFGRAAAWSYVAKLAACGLGLGGAFVVLFGFEPMFFHIATIPMSQPLAAELRSLDPLETGAPDYGFIVLEMLRWSAPFLGLVALLHWMTPPDERASVRRGWMLLVLVGVFLFPTSVVARAKIGGWVNSYHANYFFVAAAAWALAEFACRCWSARRGLRIGLVALVVVSLVELWSPTHTGPLARVPHITDNPQRRVLEYERAHPGEAWFPWHPLAVWMADGRLDHFYWAIVDRAVSGHAMGEAHLRAHLPDGMRYVIHNKTRAGADFLAEILPGFDATADLPEFPGWTVLERAPR